MKKDFNEDTWENFNEAAKGKEIYIFGAGNLGREVLKNTRNYDSAWKIGGVIDNDKTKIGSYIEGFKIIGVDELPKNSESYVILICTRYPGVIADQLDARGINNYWSYFWLNRPKNIYVLQKNIDVEQVNKLKEALFDEQSKNLLDILIQKRKIGYSDYTDIKVSGTEYFIDDYFTKDKEEVFIDCGAYDGDTINEFCKWTNDQFKAIYSFEPDTEILQKIRLNIMYRYDERIHFIPKGVYSHKTSLPFMNIGFHCGHIVEKADGAEYSVINCVALDEEINEKVTFIKMDIEGAETPALHGAKKIILRDKPKLAICIYHKPNDLLEIPLMLKDWVPEYRMHIRHYGSDYRGTILYAYIP